MVAEAVIPANIGQEKPQKYRNPTLPAVLRPRWETPDPTGVIGSYGPQVIDWAEKELAIVMSPWQRYVLIKMLRYRLGGHLVHRTAMFSTARQNGKSVIVRAFFGWLLDEGRTIFPFTTWHDIRAAAHDGKQARIIYKAVHDDLRSVPRLTKKQERRHGYLITEHPPVRLSRWLGIETDTLSFDTITGEAGSARGLSIGALAFDEVLTQKDFDMWEAVKPTQMAQTSPILILTSTAGFEDSVVLRQYYDRLRRQAAGDEPPDSSFFGVWWESRDEEAGLDWRAIAQANPDLNSGRLSRDLIIEEHRTFPPSSWRRERLNHFIDVRAEGAFNAGAWAACRMSAPLDGLPGPFALGVDVQPGWTRATICVASVRPDGRVGVEVFRDIRGSENEPVTAARIIAEIESFPDEVESIAYDKVSGAAAAFARHADDSGLPWNEQPAGDVQAACMDVDELIRSGRLAVDDPLLDAQIPLAARRQIGQEGAFRFSRGASLGPIDAIFAMTFAAHAAVNRAPVPKIT